MSLIKAANAVQGSYSTVLQGGRSEEFEIAQTKANTNILIFWSGTLALIFKEYES